MGWIGGSILGSLSLFRSDFLVFRSEYDESCASGGLQQKFAYLPCACGLIWCERRMQLLLLRWLLLQQPPRAHHKVSGSQDCDGGLATLARAVLVLPLRAIGTVMSFWPEALPCADCYMRGGPTRIR